jgi:hypothetical protein
MYKKINTKDFPTRYIKIADKFVETITVFNPEKTNYYSYNYNISSSEMQDDTFVNLFYVGAGESEDIKEEEFLEIKKQLLDIIRK